MTRKKDRSTTPEQAPEKDKCGVTERAKDDSHTCRCDRDPHESGFHRCGNPLCRRIF